MNSATQTKDDRVNLRLKQSAKAMLERAAGLEGQTLSRFILDSALSRAEKTLHKHERMRLNAQDSEAFFTALASPTEFNDTLSAALEEHDRRVTSR